MMQRDPAEQRTPDGIHRTSRTNLIDAHRTHNPKVAGLNPAPATKKINKLQTELSLIGHHKPREVKGFPERSFIIEGLLCLSPRFCCYDSLLL